MQNAMNLETLLNTVIGQRDTKQDFLTSTESAIQMVESDSGIILELDNGSSFTQTFGVTDLAHKQIASRLKMPVKYYLRLLADHPDLLLMQVNELFRREPQDRMLRTLDGNLRAFLSSSYRRLDNDIILEHTLPSIINGDLETTLLSSNVTDKKLYLKVLFPDESLQQVIGKTRTGADDIIHPAFVLSNSEIGQGALKIQSFFYRDFCTNGCTFGNIDNALDFSRSHLGGRLIEGTDFSIVSDETRAAEDKLLIGQTTDILKAIASPEFSQRMGDQLRATKDTALVENPEVAVEMIAKELGIRESERSGVLESFIKDQDYSLWGMANAVTEQANNAEAVSYDRASELEEIGGKILGMGNRTWGQYATAA